MLLGAFTNPYPRRTTTPATFLTFLPRRWRRVSSLVSCPERVPVTPSPRGDRARANTHWPSFLIFGLDPLDRTLCPLVLDGPGDALATLPADWRVGSVGLATELERADDRLDSRRRPTHDAAFLIGLSWTRPDDADVRAEELDWERLPAAVTFRGPRIAGAARCVPLEAEVPARALVRWLAPRDDELVRAGVLRCGVLRRATTFLIARFGAIRDRVPLD